MRLLNKVWLCIAAIGLGTFGVAAIAQPQQAAPQAQQPQQVRLISRFDDSTIARLLLDVQATWRTEPSPEGLTNYRASAEGGLSFTLAPRACSAEQGCTGLMMLAIFTGVETQSAAQLDAILNELNDQIPTAKLLRGGDGIVIIQAYINASFGITYTNARAQLLVFGQDIVAVRQALATLQSAQ